MPDTPERIDPPMGLEPIGEPYEVLYLVKRPAYQLILTVPTTAPSGPHAWGGLLRVRFIHEGQTCEMVLDLPHLEDFHNDLIRLWEYVERARARHRQSV